MKALAVVLLAGCGHAAAPPPAFDPFAYDPVAALATLEDRLTTASVIDATCDVRTDGAVTLALHGELHVERERVAWIKLRGEGVVTDKWSSRAPVDASLKDTPPPTWADALLIGLVRMGATHDLAAVMGGEDPELAHGDIRSWVTTSNVDWRGADPDDRTLTFDLAVIGGSEAHAELTLDARGLPRRRTQVVHFPDGDMRVVEDCERFEVR